MEKDRYVTVGQFTDMLGKIVYGTVGQTDSVVSDLPQQTEEPIKRRTAAGIIHQALLGRGEADEEHIEASLRLKDLYDCRTCAIHIAQVYAKGIMTARGDGIFGVDERVTDREAEEMLRRVTDRRLRRKPERPVSAGWTSIMWREAELMLEADRRIRLVDVRSAEEYGQGHRKGSVNVPLQALFRNPYGVCADRDAVLFLYCKGGYRSRIAAGLLVEAGYRNVYVVI